MRRTPSRAYALVALAVVAGLLAGCVGGTDPPDPADGGARGVPRLACPSPCLRPIHSGPLFEPAVAVHPEDPLRLVATNIDQTPDATTGEPGWWPSVHSSSDGGVTWTTTRPPGGPSAGTAHPFARYTAIGDPVPLFLADGTVLLSGIADARLDRPAVPYTKTGDSVVVWRSHDGGRTWPDAIVVYQGAGVSSAAGLLLDEQDKQWFALGPDGTLLLAWVRIQEATPQNASPDEQVSIVVASSADAGLTWSSPTGLVTSERLQGPFPLILADGAWLVSYLDQGTNQAYMARSGDAGATWRLDAIGPSTKFPVMAKGNGPAGQRVFLAYPASTEGLDSEQTATLRWSDDGGATWGPPLALDVPEAPGPALPALAASADGTAFVTFWHPHENGANLKAIAVRDGRPSLAFTLDATAGYSGDTGHYMGLAAMPGGGAFAVWNAQRGDTFEVTGARLVAE